MPKSFSNDYVERLNQQYGPGIFLKAVEVVESVSPLTVQRFVEHHESITYDGNTYNKVPYMFWSGVSFSHDMKLPSASISVLTADDQVISWVEEMDIRENDVTMRILHKDLLNDLSANDSLTLQLKASSSDEESGLVVFTLGLNAGLKDQLPRNLLLASDYPGMPSSNAKILS